MMKARFEDRETRVPALFRVIEITAKRLSGPLLVGTALLGMTTVFPEVQLTPELAGIAGGLGIEAMGVLLDKVANDELSADEIIVAVQAAISKSSLGKEEFDNAFALLLRRQRVISEQNQTLEDVMRQEFKQLEQNDQSILAILNQLLIEFTSTGEAKSERHLQLEAELEVKLEKATTLEIEEEDITVLISEAEELLSTGAKGEAAVTFAEIASHLSQTRQPVQARKYGKRAVELYREEGESIAAIEQLLNVANLWLDDTTYVPAWVNRDLEEAEKLASEIPNFTLLTQATLMRAKLLLAHGDLEAVEELWQQISGLLIKVSGESQVKLYCELALQKAMNARVGGHFEEAAQILREAEKRDWPEQHRTEHLELLRVLLFSEAELGNWPAVDMVYQKAQEKLQDQPDLLKDGTWLMHYAATLARRGTEEEAYKAYMEALDILENAGADIHLKHHLYQDMMHMLILHADYKISGPVFNYEAQRLDLALNVLHGTRSSRRLQLARREYLKGNYEVAIHHAKAALMLAWLSGSWASLVEAYQVLAPVYAANKQPVEALLASIHTTDDKLVEKYAKEAVPLVDVQDSKQIVSYLLRNWSSIVEQRSALKGLLNCTDIIPDGQLYLAAEYAMSILEDFSQQSRGRTVSSQAANVLSALVNRLDDDQTEHVIRFCITQLDEPLFWVIKWDLVKVLGACFTNDVKLDADLASHALTALLAEEERDAVREDVRIALVHLAQKAPKVVRDRITDYFQQRSKWYYLALIDEPVSAEHIESAIGEILRAVTPQRVDGKLSYSGIRVESIVHFNDILPSALHDFVLDGLIKAARNNEGFPNQRAAAIRTIRGLPEEVLSEKAEYVANVLFDILNVVSNEELPGFRAFFGGPLNQIIQSSLFTLGYLYQWLTEDNSRQYLLQQILLASAHEDEFVRAGAGMALRWVIDSEPLPVEIVIRLENLLQDNEPFVRHWFGSAIGHLAIQPLLKPQFTDYYIDRLISIVEREPNAMARAGMAHGLRMIAENGESGDLAREVQRALMQLKNDVSFRVRRQLH